MAWRLWGARSWLQERGSSWGCLQEPHALPLVLLVPVGIIHVPPRCLLLSPWGEEQGAPPRQDRGELLSLPCQHPCQSAFNKPACLSVKINWEEPAGCWVRWWHELGKEKASEMGLGLLAWGCLCPSTK